MKGLRDHAFIVSRESGARAGSCQLSAAEATETGVDISVQPRWTDPVSQQLPGWRLRADTGAVAARRPHFWSPPTIPIHLWWWWRWRKMCGAAPRRSSSGFPVRRTGRGARSHCLALQKEPKQRKEGKKGRGGEEEMTAAGQEREHDRGKSQRG